MLNKLNTKVVFGSWKAYNECNDRALGSTWLDMSDFNDVVEIYDELRKQGFTESELEETFIQDYECDVDFIENCDYVSIDTMFEWLELIDDSNLSADEIDAYIQMQSKREFRDKLNDDELDRIEVYVYPCSSWQDLGYHMAYEVMMLFTDNMPKDLEYYFDFEAYGKSFRDDGFSLIRINGEDVIVEVR